MKTSRKRVTRRLPFEIKDKTPVMLIESNRAALIRAVPRRTGGARVYLETTVHGTYPGVINPTQEQWGTLRRRSDGEMLMDL